MGWFKKAQEVVTGKTEAERMQIAEADKAIRKKAMDAALKERETQAIRFAQEKEKVEYEKRIKQLRQPKQGFFANVAGKEYSHYGSPFGQPRFQQPRTKIITMRKGKHGKKIKKVRYANPRQQAPRQFVDVLGMGRAFHNQRGYRVI